MMPVRSRGLWPGKAAALFLLLLVCAVICPASLSAGTHAAPDTVKVSTRNSAPVADAGADQTVLVGADVDPYSPAVVRAAMGAVLQQTVVRTDQHHPPPLLVLVHE